MSKICDIEIEKVAVSQWGSSALRVWKETTSRTICRICRDKIPRNTFSIVIGFNRDAITVHPSCITSLAAWIQSPEGYAQLKPKC